MQHSLLIMIVRLLPFLALLSSAVMALIDLQVHLKMTPVEINLIASLKKVHLDLSVCGVSMEMDGCAAAYCQPDDEECKCSHLSSIIDRCVPANKYDKEKCTERQYNQIRSNYRSLSQQACQIQKLTVDSSASHQAGLSSAAALGILLAASFCI